MFFNSVQEAVKQLRNGTEENPMTLYLAPYVYWIDDPDDPEIRTPKEGSIPFGMEIKCDWLKLKGLSKNPEHVVLASNRGQTIGAEGNFTMFRFDGIGTSSENLTFGNYCNVDLIFPLKPELNREKRASAIVQAQLIICNGDKIIAKNTRFISRLNLCPFVGGKRVFFEGCHFESTDDALCGTGVYKNCTFDFFSSKPFYHTTGTGAVFLNSRVQIHTEGSQYFTKAGGQMAIIDTRFTGEGVNYLGWQDESPKVSRNYQENVTINATPVLINNKSPENTVILNNKKLLNAYKFSYRDSLIYNTYNLLKGDDDWDPEGIKPVVTMAESHLNHKLTNIPVQLKVQPSATILETKKDTVVVTVSFFKFGSFPALDEPVSWHLNKSDRQFIKIEPGKSANTITLIPVNFTNENREVVVTVKSESGLEGAAVFEVKPEKLPPPEFQSKPVIVTSGKGVLQVNYTLPASEFKDQSQVTWYRCTDKLGNNALKTGVSRNNIPMIRYELSAGDAGYYIMAEVAPKSQRSDLGKGLRYVFPSRINSGNITTDKDIIYTDFANIPTENQSALHRGFWNFRHFVSGEKELKKIEKNAWIYGEGSQGSGSQTGLLQNGRSASLSYTPVNPDVKDIKITCVVSPFKTAGQGFSVAPLYMDMVINFDPETKTGYGMRFIRTTKYGNAVDCYLVRYQNNKVTPVTSPVSTSCFRTPCKITLELKDHTLYASAKCLTAYPKDKYPGEVKDEINISSIIEPFPFNSFGIEYNGGSTTMINSVKAEAVGINSN